MRRGSGRRGPIPMPPIRKHFDAPYQWLTGKDYADGYTDTFDVQRVVARTGSTMSSSSPEKFLRSPLAKPGSQQLRLGREMMPRTERHGSG